MDNLNIQLWLKTHGIKVAIIIIAVWFINRIANRGIAHIINSLIKKGVNISDSQKQRAKTLIKVFGSTLSFSIWTIALLTVMPEFGINIAPLLAGAGIAGIAIGMGARNLIQDYLNGVIMLLEDQYRVGENVEIAGAKGIIVDLNLRRTVIKDETGVLYFVPNGKIGIVANLSRK